MVTGKKKASAKEHSTTIQINNISVLFLFAAIGLPPNRFKKVRFSSFCLGGGGAGMGGGREFRG